MEMIVTWRIGSLSLSEEKKLSLSSITVSYSEMVLAKVIRSSVDSSVDAFLADCAVRSWGLGAVGHWA